MLVAAVVMVLTALIVVGCAAVHAITLHTRGDALSLEQHALYAIGAFGGGILSGIMALCWQMLAAVFFG